MPKAPIVPPRMQFKRALNDGTVDLDQANLTKNLRSYMDMGVKVYSQKEKEERDDVIDKVRENILQRMRQENQISQDEANKMKAKHDRYTTEYMKPIMENARKTRQEAVKAETQWLLAQSKLGGDKAQEAVERIGEIKRKADRNRGEAHVKRMEGKTREVVLPGAAPQNAGAQAGQNAAAGQLIGQRPGVPTAPSIQVQRPGVPVAPSIQVQRPELPGSPAVQPEGVPGAQPAQLQEPGIPGALPVPGQQPLDAQPAQLQQPGIPGALPVPGQQPLGAQPAQLQQPGIPGALPVPGQQPLGAQPAQLQRPGIPGVPLMPGQQPLGAQPAQLQRPGIPGAPLVPGQQPLGAQSAQGQPQAAALQQHTIKVEEQTDDISERRSEDFQQLVLIESEISDNAARGGVNRLKKYLYERNERSAEKKKQDADKKAESAASEIKKCAERWNGIREKYRTDTFHKIYQSYDTHASAYYSYTRTMENRSIAADASKKIAEYTGVYDEAQLTDIEALLKEDPFADVKLDYVPKTGLSADSLSTESEDHLVKYHRTMVMNAFAAGVNNLTQEKETERQQVRMKVMNNFRGYTAKNQFTDTTYTAMRDSGITAADRGKVTRADVDAAIAAAQPAQAAPAAAAVAQPAAEEPSAAAAAAAAPVEAVVQPATEEPAAAAAAPVEAVVQPAVKEEPLAAAAAASAPVVEEVKPPTTEPVAPAMQPAEKRPKEAVVEEQRPAQAAPAEQRPAEQPAEQQQQNLPGKAPSEMRLTADEKGSNDQPLVSEETAEIYSLKRKKGENAVGFANGKQLYGEGLDSSEDQKQLDGTAKMEKKERLRAAIRRADFFSHVNAANIQYYLTYDPDDEFNAAGSREALENGIGTASLVYLLMKAYKEPDSALATRYVMKQDADSLERIKQTAFHAIEGDTFDNVRHMGVVLLSDQDPVFWNIAYELAGKFTGKNGKRFQQRLKNIPASGVVMRMALLEEYAKDRSVSLKSTDTWADPIRAILPDNANIYVEDFMARHDNILSLTTVPQAALGFVLSDRYLGTFDDKPGRALSVAGGQGAVRGAAPIQGMGGGNALIQGMAGGNAPIQGMAGGAAPVQDIPGWDKMVEDTREEIERAREDLIEKLNSVDQFIKENGGPAKEDSSDKDDKAAEEPGTLTYVSSTGLLLYDAYDAITNVARFIQLKKDKTDGTDDRYKDSRSNRLILMGNQIIYDIYDGIENIIRLAGVVVSKASPAGAGLFRNIVRAGIEGDDLERIHDQKQLIKESIADIDSALNMIRNARKTGEPIRDFEKGQLGIAAEQNSFGPIFQGLAKSARTHEQITTSTDIAKNLVEGGLNLATILAPEVYPFHHLAKAVTFIGVIIDKIHNSTVFNRNMANILGEPVSALQGYIFDEALKSETGIKNSNYLLDLTRIFVGIDTHCLVQGDKDDTDTALTVNLMRPYLNAAGAGGEDTEQIKKQTKLNRLLRAVGAPVNWRAVLRTSITG